MISLKSSFVCVFIVDVGVGLLQGRGRQRSAVSRPANISVCCRVFSVNTARPLTTYYKTNIITTAYQIFTPLHCTANICNCSRAGQVKKLTLNKQRMITFVVWCVVSMRHSVVCQLCEAATHCATSSVRLSPASTGCQQRAS